MRFNRFGLASALVAVIALAGCASGPTEEEREAAEQERELAKQAEREANQAAALAGSCRQQLGGLLQAVDDVNSRLAVGLNYADYGSAVGDIYVQYQRVPFGRIGLKCLTAVGVPAEKAMGHHADAHDAWDGCFDDLACDMDQIDPTLQDHWAKADRLAARARSGMRELTATAERLAREAARQEKKAEAAEAKLE